MTNKYYLIFLFNFLSLLVQAQDNENYFLNPGFETGNTDNWGTWNNKIIANGAYSGAYAGGILGGVAGSLAQVVEMKSNATYTFSVYGKSKVATGESVRILIKHGDDRIKYEQFNLTNSYTKFETTFTTSELTEPITFSIYKSVAAYGELSFDEASVVEVGNTAPQVRLWSLQDIEQPTVGLSYDLQYSITPSSAYTDSGFFSVEGDASIINGNTLRASTAGEVTVHLTFEENQEMNVSETFTFSNPTPKKYYVNNSIGSDSNDGLSEDSPWSSLTEVNNHQFFPGDTIAFIAGGVWNGQLKATNRGTKEHPIVYTKYGGEQKPLIHGNGEEDYTILLENADYNHVTQFEVTNEGNAREGLRYGVVLSANNEGDVFGSKVSHLDIHNVNGQLEKQDGGGGGIFYKMSGNNPSRLVDAVIERNHIYDVQRNGIYGRAGQFGKEVLHQNLLIKNNLIERVPGDGIVAFGCEDALIEHNLCRDFTRELTNLYNNNAAAGIWAFMSNRTIIQFNEVSGHQAHWDGQGYDSDFNCDGTIIQYNYSHDNAGGFILICSNGENTGGATLNTNSIVRYNISVNDGFRTWGQGANKAPAFHLAGPVEGTQIYNNTIYWHKKPESVKNELVSATEWGVGFPYDIVFKNNLFYSEEPSTFTLNEASIIFENNAYFGEISRPQDANAITENPLLANVGPSDPLDYILQENSPLLNTGVIVENNGGNDFFELTVSQNQKPNVGAYNGNGEVPEYTGGIESEDKEEEENPKNEKPNVIVIMMDDLGYEDLGFNGCEDIQTPNMDKLAAGGANFTNAYVTYPVCGPSRAGFITGRYQQRFGFERNPQYTTEDDGMGLPLQEDTFADVMKTANYTSTIIGKWHLGATEQLHPLNRGFDEFYGHLGGGHKYFGEDYSIQYPHQAKTEWQSYTTWIQRDFESIEVDGYLTHRFTDEAVDYIERNKDNPFFMFLSYNAPHEPLEAPQEYLDKYAAIQDEDRRMYAAMVDVVDEGVGKVMDKLEELNLDENTIVFLLSDNGGPETKNASNNGVLRDGKSAVYEGGYRVPFIMYWKGEIQPIVYDKPVSSLDILATASEIIEATVNPERPLDGVNLLPFVKGENTQAPHDKIFVRKFDDNRYSIRKGDYKLVIHNNRANPRELFNLQNDISETNNIYAQNPEIVEELQADLDAWEDELIYPVFMGLIHRDNPARQVIDFNEIDDRTMLDREIELEVLASSYLPVMLKVTEGNASIEGNKLTIHEAGLITIEASQNGNEQHEAATSVTQSFSITKVDQTITITAIEDQKSSDKDLRIEIKASTDTGYPLNYSASGPVEIVDNWITIKGDTGTVEITATQEGDHIYNAAQESISFLIVESDDTVTSIVPKSTSIVLYPNPVAHTISVKCEEIIKNLEVKDAYGRSILAYENQSTINVSHLPSGVYFLVINTSTVLRFNKI